MTQNQDARDARIADQAYALWEAEGKPDGQAQNHWDRARQFIMEQDALYGTPRQADDDTRSSASDGSWPQGDAEFPPRQGPNREVS